jgi:hypothetical protein
MSLGVCVSVRLGGDKCEKRDERHEEERHKDEGKHCEKKR